MAYKKTSYKKGSSSNSSYKKGGSSSYNDDPTKLNFYGISIGRVQNPMLRVCIEKLLDPIINGKGLDLKKKLFLTDKSGIKWEFSGNKEHEKEYEKLDRAYKLLVSELNKGNDTLLVSNIGIKEQKLSRGIPFSLSTLSSTCSNLFKMKPKEVLNIAQKLYEKGYTTYPRTDSVVVPQTGTDRVKKILGNGYSEFEYKDKGDFVQEGHHAVIFIKEEFTYHNGELNFMNSGLDEREQLVYELVVRRTLAAFYNVDAIQETKTYTGKYVIGTKGMNFIYKSKEITKKGWLTIYDYKEEKDEKLKEYTKGEKVKIKEFHLKDVDIKISTNISINSLKDTLISDGISRPSTFADILEKLKSKDLIDISGTNVVAKPKGIWFWYFIKNEFENNGLFETFDKKLTRQMEDDLDQILQGKISHTDFINDVLHDCFMKYI